MSKKHRNLVTFAIATAVALLSAVSVVAPAWAGMFSSTGTSEETITEPAAEPEASQQDTGDATTTTEEGEAAATTEQVEVTTEQGDGSESAEEPSEEDEEATFIAVWGERIDAFNAGYPLDGYGETFAAAAYAYGVDPRYAPAIARVESGSGSNCTYYCNAWGWGARSWSDWDSAIWGFMGEFAAGYGHTLSYAAAMSYNEMNPDGWYAEVESCMGQIWGDESL